MKTHREECDKECVQIQFARCIVTREQAFLLNYKLYTPKLTEYFIVKIHLQLQQSLNKKRRQATAG